MARRKQAGQIGIYIRYMDDIVLVTKTRWQLRRAIAAQEPNPVPRGRLHKAQGTMPPRLSSESENGTKMVH